jgi:hypothetical protein
MLWGMYLFFTAFIQGNKLLNKDNRLNQKFLRGSRGQFFQKAPPGRRRLFGGG